MTIKVDYSEAITEINEESFEATFYTLSVKGSFYSHKGSGLLTGRFCEAYFFANPGAAIAYRDCFDPTHGVDESILLRVTSLVEEV